MQRSVLMKKCRVTCMVLMCTPNRLLACLTPLRENICKSQVLSAEESGTLKWKHFLILYTHVFKGLAFEPAIVNVH